MGDDINKGGFEKSEVAAGYVAVIVASVSTHRLKDEALLRSGLLLRASNFCTT